MIIIYLRLLWDSLNIFQQAHYQNSYLKWAMKKFIIRYLFVLICFVLCLWTKHFLFLGIIYCFIPWIKYKKKLVLTKRMIRLLVTCFILFLPFLFKWYLAALFIVFTDLWVIVANYLNKPLEKKIWKKYYQKTAKALDEYQGIKIAIGGSYGKTSTKYYLSEVLSNQHTVLMTPHSYNTPMGISKTVKDLNDLYEYFVCEMGASQEGDIDELMNLVHPDIVILTSIGNQHLETFKTIDNIKKEKRKMFELLSSNKVAFVHTSCLIDYDGKTECQIITYGEDGEYHLKNIQDNSFDVFYYDIFIGHYETKLKGRHNFDNLLAVIALADYLEVKVDISQIEEYDHRFQKREASTYTMYDDSFNANLKGALSSIDYLKRYKEKYIITPGFVELKNEATNDHLLLSKKIMETRMIPIVVKGEASNYIIEEFQKSHYQYYEAKNFKEAFSLFLNTHNNGAIVYILNDLPDYYVR